MSFINKHKQPVAAPVVKAAVPQEVEKVEGAAQETEPVEGAAPAAEKVEPPLVPAVINKTPSILPSNKKFRAGSFAYQFKTGTSVIKASPEGIYTPKDKMEEDYLLYQVSKHLISYS